MFSSALFDENITRYLSHSSTLNARFNSAEAVDRCALQKRPHDGIFSPTVAICPSSGPQIHMYDLLGTGFLRFEASYSWRRTRFAYASHQAVHTRADSTRWSFLTRADPAGAVQTNFQGQLLAHFVSITRERTNNLNDHCVLLMRPTHV